MWSESHFLFLLTSADFQTLDWGIIPIGLEAVGCQSQTWAVHPEFACYKWAPACHGKEGMHCATASSAWGWMIYMGDFIPWWRRKAHWAPPVSVQGCTTTVESPFLLSIFNIFWFFFTRLNILHTSLLTHFVCIMVMLQLMKNFPDLGFAWRQEKNEA